MSVRSAHWFFFGITLCLFNSATATSINFEVEDYVLKNGLKVILYEDHSAPIVSYQTWYRVGSVDEEPGKTGLAHLFEHMMFKGTKKISNKEFDRIVSSNGGQTNAFTSRDYTGYYIIFPSSKVQLAIELESDRMQNLIVNKENIDSEREVVKEERRMRVENSVMGKVIEVLYSTLFKVHPYRWPVIGYEKDLNSASVKDCLDFYKRFYSPSNAVIVVSGDFDKSKVKDLINMYYSDIPSMEIKRKTIPNEPAQNGERYVRLSKQVQNEVVTVGFKVPKAGERAAYALDLMANILGEGSSSRIFKRLVYRARLASSVNVSNYTPKHAGMFMIHSNLIPGKSMKSALKIIYGELWKARNELVTDKELKKTKAQVIKSYIDSLKTIHGKGHALALNEIVMGSYKSLFKDLEIYREITKEDLKVAAAEYLNPNQRSVIHVKPKGMN